MKKIIIRIFTAIMLAFGLLCASDLVLPADLSPFTTNVYADPEPDTNEEEPEEGTVDTDACQDQVGSLSWIVCPTGSMVSGATGQLYNAIEDMLIVSPISIKNDSPVYLIWKYLRSLTNIIFIICLLIVIYSQLTGLGIQNYGIKRILPRLIISVILVNLSFIICALAVDVSNVLGSSLRGTFATIGDEVLANATAGEAVQNFHLSEALGVLTSGGTIAGVVIGAFGGGGYLFYMLLITLFGALISVISGLITIAARQALVALLIMASPLAFVAYLLPNTEKWFEKWKDLLFRMLVFYPMFSFLFGASQLVGYTLILAAENTFGILLGIAVQIFPLFFGWSLMKMSGTIMNSINNGVRKLASPIEKGLSGWGMSHAEQSKQRHIANSAMPGARLRRYLDYRQSLRELDTKNSSDARRDRALESAYKTASSSRGYDENGVLRWDPVANRYTQNAKVASLYQTRVGTAESAYKNTLTAYGRTFGASAAATRLSNAHAEAYKDNMAQQFLTANEAQSDQDYLLGQYLKAQNNQIKSPYEFNRLVKSAAGSLGHLGEASIMGQVIISNATTENRRRTEARIMIAKFGVDKASFRGAAFDTDKINDDGIETDANGKPIQDDQYRMIDGYKHTPWQHYIARHKTTGEEITKEEYDRLSNIERSRYTRVKYFDIKDDAGKVVQRVYDDDAGYMKELLNDDIAIGDPINDRYLSEIGVARNDTERTGILRKYHSTITSALLTSNYKTHNATVTPMVLSQANAGNIVSKGQLLLGELQSMNVAMKPGYFLQNDAIFVKQWRRILDAAFNEESEVGLDYFFSDDDIYNYHNVNKKELKGLRIVEYQDDDGNLKKKWEEVGYEDLAQMTYEDVLKYRKNYVKHNILPKTIKQLIGTMNRELTPAVQDAQKPATLKELKDLVKALAELHIMNGDDDIAFEDRPDGAEDLMSKADSRALVNLFSELTDAYNRKVDGNSYQSDDNNNDDGSGSYTKRQSPKKQQSTKKSRSGNPKYDKFMGSVSKSNQIDERNDISNISQQIRNNFDIPYMGIENIKSNVFSLLNDNLSTNDQAFLDRCQDIFQAYDTKMSTFGSTQEAIHGVTTREDFENTARDELRDELLNLIDGIPRD